MAIIDTSASGSFREDSDSKVFIGMDLPFSKDTGVQGYFRSTSTTIEAVKQNIKNLLLTNRNERVMQPLLGLNIRRFLFEPMTEDTKIAIQNDIFDTFKTWLPFVEIKELKIDFAEEEYNNSSMNNTISITVDFNITQAPSMLESVTVQIS